MEYNRAKTIDYYFEQISSKQMDFSQMRKELESKNIDADEINIVVRQVDKQVLRHQEVQTAHTLGKNIFYGGLVLALAGVVITVATLSGVFQLGNTYTIVVAYGPIGAGLAAAAYGRSQMNRF